MSPLVAQGRGMNDFRIWNFPQVSPYPDHAFHQRVHIGHLGIVIQDVLQSFQSAALNAHFLRMRQNIVVMHLSQRKGKAMPQMDMQFRTARKAGHIPASDDFTLGDLHPIRALAANAAGQY